MMYISMYNSIYTESIANSFIFQQQFVFFLLFRNLLRKKKWFPTNWHYMLSKKYLVFSMEAVINDKCFAKTFEVLGSISKTHECNSNFLSMDSGHRTSSLLNLKQMLTTRHVSLLKLIRQVCLITSSWPMVISFQSNCFFSLFFFYITFITSYLFNYLRSLAVLQSYSNKHNMEPP